MEDFFSFYCKNNKPVELEPEDKDDELFKLEDDKNEPEPKQEPDSKESDSSLEDKIAALEAKIAELTSKGGENDDEPDDK